MPWHVVSDHAECGEGKWAVVKDGTGEVEGCHMSEADAQKQMAALYASEDDRAQMSAASINDLPDSVFAYIEPGGKKDDTGRTVPRSKRHFPIHDAAHVRNALARAPQSPFGKQAMPKIKAAAKKFGIEVSETNSQQLAPDIDVVRALGVGPVLRTSDAGSDSLGTLVIPFSPFDVWYEVSSKWEGRFMERTTPGTFVDTIANDQPSMRSLFDHGHDPQIGNKVLGPIVDLREDVTSPIGEVRLLDTSYNRDLLPGLRAGVYGSSFRMHVMADNWDNKPSKSDHNPDGIPERTITKVRALEFGPVTFPANPAATATVRSATDYFYDQLRLRDTSAYEAAARAAGLIPDLTGRPDARSAGGGESGIPATGRGDVPAISHRQRLDDGALRLRRILK